MKLKTKNILLIVALGASLVIAYNFAFLKTFEIKREIKILKEQSLQNEKLAEISSSLLVREKFADSILTKNNLKNSSIQNNLLEFLNEESEKGSFVISTFYEPHRVQDRDVMITSFQFSLRGNFQEMLDVLYKIEQEYTFGKISHVNFEKKRDYRKLIDYLECFVVVESFITENE